MSVPAAGREVRALPHGLVAVYLLRPGAAREPNTDAVRPPLEPNPRAARSHSGDPAARRRAAAARRSIDNAGGHHRRDDPIPS